MAAFHGLTLSKEFFKDLAQPLNQKGVALLAVDFRGHGDSPGELFNTTLQAQVQDVAEVRHWLGQQDSLNSKRAGFLAFSMAAVPVLEALKDRPPGMPLGLWAPLLNTAEWAARRMRGFQRDGKRVIFWQGQSVTADLFDHAARLEPRPIADQWRGPLLVCHSTRDRNQIPIESQRLVQRRLASDRAVEYFFARKSHHLFNVEKEREELLEKSSRFFADALT